MRQKLPVIVMAQFFCTSVWFAGNAVLSDLVTENGLSENFLLYLISSVQIGFILGTLIFAISGITDRYSPSLIFFLSSVAAAAANLLLSANHIGANEMLISRFLTGFFLSGIYPVGMKIAADHFENGLGKSLGFLVGGLVVGTAISHLIKSMSILLPWEFVLYASSALCLLGGLFMYLLVGDGSYRRPAGKLQFPDFRAIFQIVPLRKAILGYWGHMWELYTFWTFVPLLIREKMILSSSAISHLTFWVMATGALACAVFGLLSGKMKTNILAGTALLISGICCLAFPYFFLYASNEIFIGYLLVWGFFVVADSPMFSSLVAMSAPANIRGTTLTFVNSMGFLITVISIQFAGYLLFHLPFIWVWPFLALGPVMGISQFVMRKKERKL
jgi:MFS family permease